MPISCKIRKKIKLLIFMRKNMLTDFLRISANKEYTIVQEIDKDDIYVDRIFSDGIQKLYLERNSQKIIKVRVTNATWVIRTIKKNGKIERRILYTECNPKEIEKLLMNRKDGLYD